MPGYSYFLIASLVVAGAVIAYVGDYIGRLLGHRRATLFGLRPRSTARLVSVFAGMLITVVTIVISVGLSRDVRVAFFQAERLRSENEDLRLTRQQLEAQVEAARGEVGSMSQQRDSVSQQLEGAITQRDQVSNRLAQSRQKLEEVKNRLATVEKQLAGANGRLAAIDKQLAAADAEIKEAQETLESARGDLGKYQEQLKNALEHEAELRSERTKLEGEILDLEGQREGLQREVETLTPYVQGNLAFLVGEEVTREVIPRGLSLEETTAGLGKLLERTDQLAQTKGSQPNHEGRAAVSVRERSGISLAEIIRETADSIMSSPQDMVVRITSASNCLKGQPLVFEIALHRNNFWFPRGQLIVSTTVDSSLDQAEIFQQLSRLLDDAASRVFHSGVLRLERPAYTQELFNAVTEIKDVGGNPTVTVLATEDIWTAGPLALGLKVEGGPF